MKFEVEQKFQVPEVSDFEQSLSAMGASLEAPILQLDHYFAHPARDFSKTDEALRIRSTGNDNFVTYKGPKIDATTKTRRELELPIESGSGAAIRFAELLEALGFRPVAAGRKQRRCVVVPWRNQNVVVVLDNVENLADFAELEITTTESGIAHAKQAILSLAQELSLCEVERRSYLELVLEKNRGVV